VHSNLPTNFKILLNVLPLKHEIKFLNMVIKFTKKNKNPKVIVRTKNTWKFWKTIEKFKWWIWMKPMVELTKKLDRNYQSLNLNHVNRQSIPRYDLLITTKYLKIYQNVWTWIGLKGLQKGGSKKLKKLSKVRVPMDCKIWWQDISKVGKKTQATWIELAKDCTRWKWKVWRT
jgi:hypothetical protein